MRLPAFGAAAIASLVFASNAFAADEAPSIALSQLEPTPPGDAFVAVPSPFIGGHLVPRALLLFDYAHRPLVLESAAAEGDVVAGQGLLHLGASFSVLDRLLLSFDLPMALLENGDAPAAGGVSFDEPGSFSLGDLRLGARVRLVGERGSPIAVAVGAYLHLPTADSPSFVGEGDLRDTPQLSIGGDVGPITYAAMGGFAVRGGQNPTSVIYAAGVSTKVLLDMLTVGGELSGSTDIQNGVVVVGSKEVPRTEKTSLELLLEARARPLDGLLSPLSVSAFGGPGLTQAIGTPAFRVGAAIRWDPKDEPAKARSLDADNDSVPDNEDACPFVAGLPEGNPRGCPAKP